MKPVYQTRFGFPCGNCFQAVLASMLELELEQVPDFAEYMALGTRAWWNVFETWSGEFGLFPFELEINCQNHQALKAIPKGQEVWLVGNSPRGPFLHAVVGIHKGDLTFDVIHDPHPEAIKGSHFVGRPRLVGFFVVRDPWKFLIQTKCDPSRALTRTREKLAIGK